MNKADEREVEAAYLQRSAHTLRLEGDYVTAQAVERELERLLSSSAPPNPSAVARKLLKTAGQRSTAVLAALGNLHYKGGSRG